MSAESNGPALAGKPGSQTALRQLNQRRIVEVLRSNGSATQAELSRRTGLSTATVSNIIKTMTGTGLVSTARTTSSGRRALAVTLNDNNGVAAGVDFGRRHLRVLVATLGYEVLAEEVTALPRGYQAADGIAAADRLLDKVLDSASISKADVLGVGVGIPGPLDRRAGVAIGGTIHPEWVGVQVRKEMEAVLQLPVLVDNDCNLGALAEITWGRYTGVPNLVFVKIGTGIGSGLILDGRLFYGKTGVTGEIGHTTLDDTGVICRCGNRGCLETQASTTVILDLLSGHSPAPLTTGDVVRNALAGDTATLRVIDDVGMAVGRALGTVANLINPDVIVVGGPLSGLGDILISPIQRGVSRYAIPVAGAATTLTMTDLEERAEALGAATLVIQAAASLRS